MPKRILFVENEERFLKERKDSLEQEGYEVIPAYNPTEARRAFDQYRVDLAIIDIRLIDDTDEKDISGLMLAKETASSIPKIILTRFPTYNAVREAYGPNLDELPAAVDFVDKTEGPDALLRAVRRAFRIGTRYFRASQDEIREQLNKDHQEAREEANTQYRWSLTISILCAVVIIGGIGLALFRDVTAGVVSSLAGLGGEFVTYLFFKQLEHAHRRVDRFNEELLQTKRVETLLAACDQLSSDETKELVIAQIINTAARNWLVSSTQRSQNAGPLRIRGASNGEEPSE